METPVAVRFAEAVRHLTAAARAHGLDVPAFRSPPRTPGVPRALRRYAGGAVVAITLRGRSFDAVLADMVDGVLAVNGRQGPQAARLRAELLAAIGLAPPLPSSPRARVAEWQTQAA